LGEELGWAGLAAIDRAFFLDDRASYTNALIKLALPFDGHISRGIELELNIISIFPATSRWIK
jgi:hypothetical protein